MKKIMFTALAPERLDKKNGVVYGVAVCTEGPAKGHGLLVDRTTLAQLLASANAKGKIPCKLDHKTGISQVCGFLTDFYLEGGKLRADWHLLKSQPNFEHTWDLIENLHDTCGLSVSFTGDAQDGRARCSDLLSADFVAHPATGNGLFSRRDLDALNENSDHPETTDTFYDMANTDDMTDEQLSDLLHNLMDHIDALESENAELRQELEDRDDDDVRDDHDEQEDPVIEEHGAAAGPFTRDHASALRSHDFESRIAELQLAGKSQKEAHIAALKEFARQRFSVLNL